MFGEMNIIRELATKYSKPQLARMVQMGELEPQKAVMAGMMIDRIAKSAMTPPQSTVAQDVLGEAPTTAQGQIPPQMAQAPQGPPQMAAHGGLMGMLPYSDGVAALPSNLHNMAGGGIVAFAEGGAPEPTYLPDNIDFSKGKIPIYISKAPEQVDLAKAAGMRTESERQAGFDPDMYKKLRDEELASKEDLGKQREEAKGMAALQFGLGLLGARKGQEFQTASVAATQALAQYGNTIKDIRASEKEMKKAARELTMAENAYKKSNADKDLARVEESKKQLQAHEENIAALKNSAVKLGEDVYKTNSTNAAHLLATDKNILSNEKIASMNIAAQKALQGNSEIERMLSRIDALRKAGKEDEAKELEARYRSLKGIDSRSSGKVTDKELQDAYEERRKQIIGKKALEEFDRMYPTWREYADAQGRSGQPSTGTIPQSNAPRGQVDTNNPLLR